MLSGLRREAIGSASKGLQTVSAAQPLPDIAKREPGGKARESWPSRGRLRSGNALRRNR